MAVRPTPISATPFVYASSDPHGYQMAINLTPEMEDTFFVAFGALIERRPFQGEVFANGSELGFVLLAEDHQESDLAPGDAETIVMRKRHIFPRDIGGEDSLRVILASRGKMNHAELAHDVPLTDGWGRESPLYDGFILRGDQSHLKGADREIIPELDRVITELLPPQALRSFLLVGTTVEMSSPINVVLPARQLDVRERGGAGLALPVDADRIRQLLEVIFPVARALSVDLPELERIGDRVGADLDKPEGLLGFLGRESRLRGRVHELARVLDGTSLVGDAVALRADVTTLLDAAVARQAGTLPPAGGRWEL